MDRESSISDLERFRLAAKLAPAPGEDGVSQRLIGRSSEETDPVTVYRDDYAARVASFGEDHPETVQALALLAAKLLETGAYKEAEAAFTRVAAYWHGAAGPSDERFLSALSCRGEVLERL